MGERVLGYWLLRRPDPSKSSLGRGTKKHSLILNSSFFSSHVPPSQATAYTQVVQSSHTLANRPPTPNSGGADPKESESKSPRIGGFRGLKGRKRSRFDLCVHGSLPKGARGIVRCPRSNDILPIPSLPIPNSAREVSLEGDRIHCYPPISTTGDPCANSANACTKVPINNRFKFRFVTFPQVSHRI